MAKKYLTQEEAAAQLGIGAADLNALRERGEIRGFSDRGTWKFKSEDVEELNRTRQATSDPEIPMLSESAIESEEDELGSQETVIRDGSVFDDDSDARPGPSDSDVRLILDSSVQGEGGDAAATSDSDVQLVGANVSTEDSDSDVQLVDSNVAIFEDSDSDVRLATSDELMSAADSDSDVRLIAAEDGSDDSDVRLVGSDSDSDVRLTTPGGSAADSDSDVQIFEGSPRPGSDSDVKLIGSGILAGSDSDVKLIGTGDSAVRRPGRDGDSDSEVALVAADGSGLLLDGDDDASSVFAVDEPEPGGSATFTAGSGILGPDDSGINLESLSSGVELEEGSGVGSGIGSDIGLAADDGEDVFLGDASSITFADEEASGIALEADDGDRTMPDLDVPDFGDEDNRDQTDFEMTAIVDEADTGETFNLALDDVDDDDPFASGGSGAAKPASSSGSATFDLAADDGEEEFEDEYEEDAFDDEDEDDDDLEVAADIDGEDDELDDLDAFDEGDDFDDDFESGGLAAPAARGMQAPAEAEWGAFAFTGLALTLLFLSFGGMLAYDLVRSMWAYDNSATIGTGLLQWFAETLVG